MQRLPRPSSVTILRSSSHKCARGWSVMSVSPPISSPSSIAKPITTATSSASPELEETRIIALPNRNPAPSTARAHWQQSDRNGRPTRFRNPWPSYNSVPLTARLRAILGSHPERNFVPVPTPNLDGTPSADLIPVRKPQWDRILQPHPDLRATWLGHAGWLIHGPSYINADGSSSPGFRILFDPFLSERSSPVTWAGPKRYTAAPCKAEDLPAVDLVCISHNHYDHLDFATILSLVRRPSARRLRFIVPLNLAAWFKAHICPAEDVVELDWWDSVEVTVPGNPGTLHVTSTPAQHNSARSLWNVNESLWSGYVLEMEGPSQPLSSETTPSPPTPTADPQKSTVFFAGDTAYQAFGAPSPCPAFSQIGTEFPSIDLALVPIGLFSPPDLLGGVHCSPAQALQIYRDVKARVGLGMHFGTVRGGVSARFEDVREPLRKWRAAAEKEGVWIEKGGGGDGAVGKESVEESEVLREGVGVCDIGETVAVARA